MEPLPDFVKYNLRLVRQVQEVEDKIRRRDILVSEDDLADFYRERIDRPVYDAATLQEFLSHKGGDRSLRMDPEDLRRYRPDREELARYPDRVSLGNTVFPVDYQFDPGAEADGVTVRIDAALAPSVPKEALEWGIPGLFAEKITALIKGLPKEFRRRLVPVADTVAIIDREMPRDEQLPLATALSRFVKDRMGIDVPASAWPLAELPEHLRMRVSLRGPRGEELAAGRDLGILGRSMAAPVCEEGLAQMRKRWERADITEWDMGELPPSVGYRGEDGGRYTAYPALVDDGGRVSLILAQNRDKALALHRKGVARLAARRLGPEIRMLKPRLIPPRDLDRAAGYFGGPKAVAEALYERIAGVYLEKDIRDPAAFEVHVDAAGEALSGAGADWTDGAWRVLAAYHECRTRIYDLENAHRRNPAAIKLLSGLRDELVQLVPERFISLYDAERMVHLARYIRAIAVRAERGILDPDKEKTRAAEVAVHVRRLREVIAELSPSATDEKRAAVEDFFWLIEEYKVSLFAQELKTAVKVSPRKLEDAYGEIRRMA